MTAVAVLSVVRTCLATASVFHWTRSPWCEQAVDYGMWFTEGKNAERGGDDACSNGNGIIMQDEALMKEAAEETVAEEEMVLYREEALSESEEEKEVADDQPTEQTDAIFLALKPKKLRVAELREVTHFRMVLHARAARTACVCAGSHGGASGRAHVK